MQKSEEDPPIYEFIIDENEEKAYQIRLTISEFRDKTYLNFRKYFLSYEGDWLPSKEGVSMELGLENVSNLLNAVTSIVADSEAINLLDEVLDEKRRNRKVP